MHFSEYRAWRSYVVRVRRGPPNCLDLWHCLLQLHDPEAVLARVDEPRHACKADVSASIDGLQAGQVVFLNVHPARAQRSYLCVKITDPPGSLSLRVGCSDSALRNGQLSAAAASERDGVGAVVQDFKSDLVPIEIPARVEIGGQQNDIKGWSPNISVPPRFVPSCTIRVNEEVLTPS